ncbi:receptor-like serine/threonine-protein kinase ALE2 isoform X2 [Physcomitrium patens]|uniref:receptor-like serine/threonine-protein kinase ALE2 isoform X2 n=1 Tax=Physcomitrium patens TaxID=3218 RepID=UPI000D160DDF|nr:receptor-like serine/threonine-protein kinase ALE2 isoform X2 [Physcomitrium patens]|eukprot:XP_024387701.1 receptor-like serine/threonine-protein kinase ALE2 isoform X2 [Physcomitrella patens]
MRSNHCWIAELLSVLLLAATLPSLAYDTREEITACRNNLHCKNLESLALVVPSRRGLLTLGHPSLVHFARRPLPFPTSTVTYGKTSSDESISLKDASGPSAPLVVSATDAPPDSSLNNTLREAPSAAPPPLEPGSPSPSLNFTPPADCRQACPDGYTYTLPGAPSCSCVIPMRAQFQLGIKLEKLFPLVAELAKELASGLFLQTSQVRILGANSVEPDQDKTIVSAEFVPLDTKFDNTTAHLLATRLWGGEVPLNETPFGIYSVIYITYPGLSPPPPAQFPGNVPPPGPANQLPSGVNPNSKNQKLSSGLIAVIALSSVMGVLLFIGFMWLILLRRSLKEKTPPLVVGPQHSYFNQKPEGSLLSGSLASSATISYGSSMANYMGTAKTFTLAELERATDNFRPDNVVGEGGFGRVYQGVLDSGIQVAVKVLTRDDHQVGREFIAEVEMLSRLHHRNLVRLIGICTEEIRCLVYELITNGSVESHLHGLEKYTAPLNWDARVKIALGAARGLAYLHEDSQPRVIHRDFKGSNILLEDDYTPKVSDFGLAKSATDGGKEHISTRVMGTFGYVAPEYAMTGHLLVKSDVYSYGVVLLELLSGRKPVDMSQPPGQENLVTWARPLLTSKDGLRQLVDPCLKDNFPFDHFAKVAAIASMCVQPEVSHRPFMGEVVQALKFVYNETEVIDDGRANRISSTASDLVETQNTQFLGDSSFISVDYDSGPLETLELEQRKRMPFSASTAASASGGFFRQLSDSFRRYSVSAPPKASSLPRTPWYALGSSKPAGSMSEARAARFLDPQRRRFYGFWH